MDERSGLVAKYICTSPQIHMQVQVFVFATETAVHGWLCRSCFEIQLTSTSLQPGATFHTRRLKEVSAGRSLELVQPSFVR